MKKSLGVHPFLYPMPVLMIATYGENETVDVMNMAWGGICAENMVALNIDEDHKTTKNIKKRMAFTLSVANVEHLAESDFFGIASGNKMTDKFLRSGMHAVRSSLVDAPIIEEYPLTLECKVVEIGQAINGFRVVGEILNVLADEKIIDSKGKIDPTLIHAVAFDQFQNGYYALGEKVGKAWQIGAKFMKK